MFEILSRIRLSLIPSRLLQDCVLKIDDMSIQIALKSVQRDALTRKGSLASLVAQPRKSAKKHIYVFGGSKREVGTGWKQLSEATLNSVVCFDTFQYVAEYILIFVNDVTRLNYLRGMYKNFHIEKLGPT